jgi:hypothetical protein
MNRIFEPEEGGYGRSEAMNQARYVISKLLKKEHQQLPLKDKFHNLFR